MALSITINKVAVADSFAAGTKVADIVVSGGTSPYSYSLASGGDYFQISGTEVQVINEMDISNIQSFSVFIEDSTSGEPVSGVSEEVYPNITAEIQSRFNSVNKIYKITQNIDLNHGILTIPFGCTLDFQGGSFSSGIIIGNQTKIKNNDSSIFTNITISGTWNIKTIYSDWFNFNKSDSTHTFRNLINLSNDSEIIISEGDYVVTVGEEPVFDLKSNTSLIINGSITVSPNNLTNYSLIRINNTKNISIVGGALYGDVRTHIGSTGEWGHGISVLGGKNVSIKNTTLDGFWGDGINISHYGDDNSSSNNTMSKYIYIENVVCSYNRRLGISITGANYVWIKNSTFISNGSINGTLPKAGIDVEANSNSETNNIFIDNCATISNDIIISRYIRDSYQEGKTNRLSNSNVDGSIKLSNNVTVTNCTSKYIELDTASDCFIASCNITEFVRIGPTSKNILFRNCYISSTTRSHGYTSLINFATNDSTEIENIQLVDCILNTSNSNGIITASPNVSTIRDKGISSIPAIGCIFMSGNNQFAWTLGDVIKCVIYASRVNISNFDRAITYLSNSIHTTSNVFVFTENTDNIFTAIGNNCISDSAGSFINKLSYTGSTYSTNNSYRYGSNTDGGTTSDRPTLVSDQRGFIFYDTTISKMILWNGTTWVNMDGTALAEANTIEEVPASQDTTY